MPIEYIFPIRPTVQPNESILGYLKRLADALHLDAVSLLGEKAGLPTPLQDTTVMADPSKLASSLVDRWQALQTAHFRPAGAKYEYGKNLLPLEYLHLDTMRVCRECLKERPYHRHFWHFAPIETCHLHGTVLYDTCPNCFSTLTWNSPKITACPHCDGSILNTGTIEQPQATTQAARCLLHIGGLVPASDATVIPPILGGLSLADAVAFLDFLGHLVSWRGPDNPQAMPELVADGYAAALEWPESFHNALSALEERNKDRGRSPFALLHPFNSEIVLAPFATWGGRIQSALIRYLAYRDDMEIDVRHALWGHIFKMRTYCPEEEVLATLRVSKEQLRTLRSSPDWDVHIHRAEGREWFKFGHVVQLRERLTKDIFGYHSRYYQKRDYEWRTPLEFGLPGMTMRSRKKPTKRQI